MATSADVRLTGARTALLPVGRFEQHGDFLPLATDTIVACAIANAISDAYRVLLLPPLTISCSHEHSAWPGTISVRSATLAAIVGDVAASVRHHGTDRLVLVNGHGGNYVLSNVVQEATVDGPVMVLFPGREDWNRARQDAGITTSGGDDMHAGELETSVLLHALPRAVREGNATADHEAPDRPHLLALGMAAYTTSGVIGRPSLGTAEKGEAVLRSLVESFADYLRVVGDLDGRRGD